MSTAYRHAAKLAAVFGILSVVTLFLLIQQRTVDYQSQIETFTQSALSTPNQVISGDDFPALRADLGAPRVYIPIIVGIVLGLLAVTFCIKGNRRSGPNYLGTTGMVFGLFSIFWIGLTVTGAV